MSEDLEPLSQDAKDLLGLERLRDDVLPGDQQRVLGRLVQAQAFGAATAAAAAGKLTVVKVLLAATVGAALGGGAVGVKMSRELDEARAEASAARAALAERPPMMAVPPPAPVPAPPPEPKAPPTPAKPAPKPEAPTPVAPAPAPSTMGEESALIDQARMALLKGDFANAEAALASYRMRFPRGHLVEEQELMAIQVLLGRHQEIEARAAADRFRSAHPDSTLIRALDVLLEGVP